MPAREFNKEKLAAYSKKKLHPRHIYSEITFDIEKLPEDIGKGYQGILLSDGFPIIHISYFDFLGRVEKKADATKYMTYITEKYKRLDEVSITTWELRSLVDAKELSQKLIDELLDSYVMYLRLQVQYKPEAELSNA